MASLPAVVGIDFGGTKIAVASADARGARLGGAVVKSFADLGAGEALERGLTAAAEMVDALPPTYHLAAVGAVTFGIPHSDRVDLAPAIPGWANLQFGDVLRSRFPGVPVRIATDVKAAAVAESAWGALSGIGTGIYVNLGTGFAVAIVVDGAVLVGAHGAAGEIGYSVRSVADVAKSREQRSVLEGAVSGAALMARARSILGREIPLASDVFTLAASDPAAADLAARFVDELALHLINLAIAIDPVRIVLGGGLVAAWHHFAPPLKARLTGAVPYPPELVVAAFPYEAPLMGALAIGLGTLSDAPLVPSFPYPVPMPGTVRPRKKG